MTCNILRWTSSPLPIKTTISKTPTSKISILSNSYSNTDSNSDSNSLQNRFEWLVIIHICSFILQLTINNILTISSMFYTNEAKIVSKMFVFINGFSCFFLIFAIFKLVLHSIIQNWRNGIEDIRPSNSNKDSNSNSNSKSNSKSNKLKRVFISRHIDDDFNQTSHLVSSKYVFLQALGFDCVYEKDDSSLYSINNTIITIITITTITNLI